MTARKAFIVSISSDIGHALALDLHADGWAVGGTFRTKSAATEELENLGLCLVHCDLAEADGVKRAAAETQQRFGLWDILVLAPGAQDPIGLFQDTPFSEWSASIEINFIEQLHFVHALLPTRNLTAKDSPGVLFFAGGGTNNATVRYSAYTISKIGLIKMCELLDAEIKDTRFTILGPGWVKTKIHQATLDSGTRSGDNLQKTRDRFARDEFVPISKVIACCRWIFDSPRERVSGRNFSAAGDAWGDPRLDEQLSQDPHMYKLRRSGNDWKTDRGA